MKRILTIVGARPQIIKAAAISRAIKNNYANQLEEFIIHTGQHYDENMSAIFFDELGIPKPYSNLQVGSSSHAEQTAQIMTGVEKLINETHPDAILIYGDTNSTLAAALAASKIHIPVIHIEAGLRSFNKSMPEEINRIMSDHVSTMLFCPTQTAIDNLEKEGFSLSTSNKANIDTPHVYLCGDIMYDNSIHFSQISASKSSILNDLNCKENEFVLVTIHRNANTDDAERLNEIISSLLELANEHQLNFVLPLHPRTQKMFQQLLTLENQTQLNNNQLIRIVPPAGFLDMIELERNAKLVVTDSGGVQKEAYFFKKPCVILRPETEWVEIVQNGNAILVDANKLRIKKAFKDLLTKSDFTYPNFFGDGKASEFIVGKIIENLA
jgi:UDP-GlcNAc3NAcA epimerase